MGLGMSLHFASARARLTHVDRCADAEDALECLRAVDTAVLQDLDTTLCRSAFVGTFVFVPVVDGALITQSPIEAFVNGDVNGVRRILLPGCALFNAHAVGGHPRGHQR